MQGLEAGATESIAHSTAHPHPRRQQSQGSSRYPSRSSLASGSAAAARTHGADRNGPELHVRSASQSSNHETGHSSHGAQDKMLTADLLRLTASRGAHALMRRSVE